MNTWQVRDAVAESIRSHRAAWCDMVLLELMRGNSCQREQATAITETLTYLPMDKAVWRRAIGLATRTTEAGQPVPNTDILIVACGQVHGASFIHRDQHFEWLERL